MSVVSTMKSGDFEHLEVVDNPLAPRGRSLAVRVAKAGGGTEGRAYDGTWYYRVTFVGSQAVLLQGDDLRTGTPKTHRQVVRLILDFLPEWLTERGSR